MHHSWKEYDGGSIGISLYKNSWITQPSEFKPVIYFYGKPGLSSSHFLHFRWPDCFSIDVHDYKFSNYLLQIHTNVNLEVTLYRKTQNRNKQKRSDSWVQLPRGNAHWKLPVDKQHVFKYRQPHFTSGFPFFCAKSLYVWHTGVGEKQLISIFTTLQPKNGQYAWRKTQIKCICHLITKGVGHKGKPFCLVRLKVEQVTQKRSSLCVFWPHWGRLLSYSPLFDY